MWCNHQLGQLLEQALELQQRATVWIINPQDIASTARYKERRSGPFTFLADENLEVVNLYGIYHMQHAEHGYIPYPVTFIVKPDDTVARRFLGLQPRDRPKVEDVIQTLDSITKNTKRVG
ncbi:MAG: redoxin domain-containing protein [Chloroflexi bacterium]|nr:redoxin domain-containing protein [Chloroflexota bacterium]